MDPAKERYSSGQYEVDFGDGPFKAAQMQSAIEAIENKDEIRSFADIGCGNAEVLSHLSAGLIDAGFPLQRVVGYDILPFANDLAAGYPAITFKQMDFLEDTTTFDLITLNDVIEHVSKPQEFLARIAARSRYVALHVPLDDRWSVLLANQYNYRIGPVGHISFWNPATALNLITAAGLLPLHCRFTPGYQAPSGRVRFAQRLVLPIRHLLWKLSPGLTARSLGGVSLAVLCRGTLATDARQCQIPTVARNQAARRAVAAGV